MPTAASLSAGSCRRSLMPTARVHVSPLAHARLLYSPRRGRARRRVGDGAEHRPSDQPAERPNGEPVDAKAATAGRVEAGDARLGDQAGRGLAGGCHTERPDDLRVTRLGKRAELIGREPHAPARRQPEPSDEPECALAAGALAERNESTLNESLEREAMRPRGSAQPAHDQQRPHVPRAGEIGPVQRVPHDRRRRRNVDRVTHDDVVRGQQLVGQRPLRHTIPRALRSAISALVSPSEPYTRALCSPSRGGKLSDGGSPTGGGGSAIVTPVRASRTRTRCGATSGSARTCGSVATRATGTSAPRSSASAASVVRRASRSPSAACKRAASAMRPVLAAYSGRSMPANAGSAARAFHWASL